MTRWMIQRIKLRNSAESQKDAKATESVERFLKAFDNHMRGGQLCSDLYLKDPLRRFVHV
jgi:hypothetical protein